MAPQQPTASQGKLPRVGRLSDLQVDSGGYQSTCLHMHTLTRGVTSDAESFRCCAFPKAKCGNGLPAAASAASAPTALTTPATWRSNSAPRAPPKLKAGSLETAAGLGAATGAAAPNLNRLPLTCSGSFCFSLSAPGAAAKLLGAPNLKLGPAAAPVAPAGAPKAGLSLGVSLPTAGAAAGAAGAPKEKTFLGDSAAAAQQGKQADEDASWQVQSLSSVQRTRKRQVRHSDEQHMTELQHAEYQENLMHRTVACSVLQPPATCTPTHTHHTHARQPRSLVPNSEM